MDRRTGQLPAVSLRASGLSVALDLRVADSFLSRLRGLSGRSVEPRDMIGLWFPRTRSIHTFGMSFALDLVWLDWQGRVLRIEEAVQPGQLVTCAAARSVIELAGGSATQLGFTDGLRLTA